MEANGARVTNGTGESTADAGRRRARSRERRPDRSDVFEALSHPRRRCVLRHLLERKDGAATKYELSKRVAARENGIPVEEVSTEQCQRVYLDLHRNHLPLMADRGVVESGTDREEVALVGGIEDLRTYLGADRRSRPPWGQVYVLLGLVSGAWAVVGWAGLTPFTLLGGYGWAIATALLVAGVGVIHVSLEEDGLVASGRSPPDVDGRSKLEPQADAEAST